MNWVQNWEGFKLFVPIITHKPDSAYEITIQRRPEYCDRGQWLIFVDGNNDLDAADGWPRYFLGSEDDVKHQVEMWLARREAYQTWLSTQRVIPLEGSHNEIR